MTMPNALSETSVQQFLEIIFIYLHASTISPTHFINDTLNRLPGEFAPFFLDSLWIQQNPRHWRHSSDISERSHKMRFIHAANTLKHSLIGQFVKFFLLIGQRSICSVKWITLIGCFPFGDINWRVLFFIIYILSILWRIK